MDRRNSLSIAEWLVPVKYKQSSRAEKRTTKASGECSQGKWDTASILDLDTTATVFEVRSSWRLRRLSCSLPSSLL